MCKTNPLLVRWFCALISCICYLWNIHFQVLHRSPFDGQSTPSPVNVSRGMTELLRPSLYGSQHPLVVVQKHGNKVASTAEARYVVVGHCCESGDLISPEPDQPETLQQRPMGKAEVGTYSPSFHPHMWESIGLCPVSLNNQSKKSTSQSVDISIGRHLNRSTFQIETSLNKNKRLHYREGSGRLVSWMTQIVKRAPPQQQIYQRAVTFS